jgi:hypothetical protein
VNDDGLMNDGERLRVNWGEGGEQHGLMNEGGLTFPFFG